MPISVGFEIINGKRVFRIVTEPNNPCNKIIIMSHGFKGTSVGPSRAFVDFEKSLLAAGFTVLRFDQPCSGNSEGNFIDSSFIEWINTITYFVEFYNNKGYTIALLGQSMGATAAMVAAGQTRLTDKVSSVLLWVPDAKTTVDVKADKIYEEAGQKYMGQFWLEAQQANFFHALKQFGGNIHLVFGETDQHISSELRQQTIQAVIQKGQPYLILAGQDHSSWEYEATQHVIKEELAFLEKYIS